MNKLYAILRLYTDRYIAVYTASDNFYQNKALLDFVETLRPATEPPKHPTEISFSLPYQWYQIHLIPEGSDKEPHLLVVIQLTEKIEANLQDEHFLDHIRLFFHKGAHDIKNLLNNIQMLLRKNMVDKSQQYLEELKTYYLQQIHLFYQALDQRVELEKPAEPTVQTVQFGEMVTQIKEAYHADSPDFTLITDFEACPAVRYRQDYLSNMLKTLLDNAAKYRAADRPLIVKMHTKMTKEHVIFDMEDNGEGFDAVRHKDKLFQPFQRFSQKGNGQGIGLHLTKVTVERNGGEITVDSTPNQGTRVTLFLKEY